MSLTVTEAQRLYDILQRINVELDVTKGKVKEQQTDWKELRRLAFEMVDLLDHMGLGKTHPEIVSKLREIIFLMNMLKLARIALTATTPLGQLAAGIGFLGSAIGMASVDSRRRW